MTVNAVAASICCRTCCAGKYILPQMDFPSITADDRERAWHPHPCRPAICAKMPVSNWPLTAGFQAVRLSRTRSCNGVHQKQHAAAVTVVPHGMTRCMIHAAQRGLLAVWILLLSLASLAAAQSAAGTNGTTVLFSSTFQSRRVAGSGPLATCHSVMHQRHAS